MQFEAASKKLEQWIKNQPLPLWRDIGFNPDSGKHFEHLSPAGNPDKSTNLRLRVQSRQIFAHAYAEHMGWNIDPEKSRKTNEHLLAFLKSKTVGTHYPHLLDPNSEIIDYRQDLYDYAFHILAFTWVYRVYKNKSALDHAIALFEHVDFNFKSPYGGWTEGNYISELRRQNPHMHMLESLLALYEATDDSIWLDRASQIINLFEHYFYDPEHQVLLEFFNEDWTIDDERPIHSQIEPGHMMEWVWLLGKYSKHSSLDYSQTMLDLYHSALKTGMSKSGLLYDQVDPLGNITKGTKRCWPMTEAIKANVALAECVDAKFKEGATRAIETLFENYIPSPDHGAYYDQLDENDDVLTDRTSASTLYHLIVAAGEASLLRSSFTD